MLLAPVLKNCDDLRLSNEQIEGIVSYLKNAFINKQEFFKHSQQALCQEMDNIQNRISKLVDLHMDGTIDSDTYKFKLEEFKKRQREIAAEMQAHIDADELVIITAKTVLDLAKRSRELYESSNIDEKRQLLNFVCSNFLLDSGKLRWELREPFSILVKMGGSTVWLGR